MDRRLDVDAADVTTEVGGGAPLRQVFTDTLAYARTRDYRGWDYADGMSSRLLRWLPFEHKWVNLGVQEVVKRAPVNLRPLFLVEQRRNFKGTGLFAMANLAAADLASEAVLAANPAAYEREAASLLEWLLDNQCDGYRGFCGTHQHVIQGLDHQGLPSEPDLVSTAYGVKALLAGASLDGRYADVARTAAEFAREDMDYREVPDGAKIRYFPKHPDDCYTLNAGAIAARLFLDLYDHFGDESLLEPGERLLDFVASRQTEVGGWYYRDPPERSHLGMDNHHNGFILEALLRHREVTGTDRYRDVLAAGLDFYRTVLYDDDGAPNFSETSAYPRDIHAATQGILVFTYADDLAFARRIVDWTLDNLYVGGGRFVYRQQRHYTKRITLMRWCQAWMAYALGVHLTTALDAPQYSTHYKAALP